VDPRAARPEPIGALRRALRLPLFATTTVILGLCAHLVGGGHRPSAALLAALVTAVAVPWAAVCPRRRPFPVVFGLVAATQLGIHGTLATDCSSTGSAMPSHTGPGMLAAHTLASLLLALWLHRQELATWRVAVVLFGDLAEPVPLAVPPARPPLGVRVPVTAKRPLHLAGTPRRGPPLPLHV
jgi:hypothetical protein